MASAKLYSYQGDLKESVDLPSSLFDAPVNRAVLYDAVRMYLANRRAGSAKVKARSEVNYSGAKPYRQKGTGRARAGTRKSPLWRGGGITFGPAPRDFTYSITKKMKKIALLSALADKSNSDDIVIVEGISMDSPRTKTFADFLRVAGLYGRKVLFVMESFDENVYKSIRNISGVEFMLSRSINAYQVLKADKLLFTREALDSLEEVFA